MDLNQFEVDLIHALFKERESEREIERAPTDSTDTMRYFNGSSTMDGRI